MDGLGFAELLLSREILVGFVGDSSAFFTVCWSWEKN